MLLASELDAEHAAGQKDDAAQPADATKARGPALKAGLVAHGTDISKTDFERVKSPLGIVAVEGDNLFPDKVREEGVKTLKAKGVEVESWVYPGVPHGKSCLSP